MIAGYNTKSKREQTKYDTKALCRYIGWVVLSITFCIAIISVGFLLEVTLMSFVVFVIMVLGIALAVIYANTGKRFQRSSSSQTDCIGEHGDSND